MSGSSSTKVTLDTNPTRVRDLGESQEQDQEEQDRAVALLELSISLIDQALDILHKHLKEDRQLTHASKLMPGGSVGKHFRHVSSLYLQTYLLNEACNGDRADIIQVMEMFRALLLPLQPTQPSFPPGLLEVNYDAILPATRRPLARSLPACRKAMNQIKDDLESWRRRSDRETGVSDGVAGETGRAGLVGEMRREVKLVAVTPTKQEMKSSVGREVRSPISHLPCICIDCNACLEAEG